MKFDPNETPEEIQIEKKQFEKKEHFIKRIIPHRNHKVFEYDKTSKKLSLAKYDNIPTIKWEDAVKENYSKYHKINQKENSIYFSALNFKNAQKVLQRDYGIKSEINF